MLRPPGIDSHRPSLDRECASALLALVEQRSRSADPKNAEIRPFTRPSMTWGRPMPNGSLCSGSLRRYNNEKEPATGFTGALGLPAGASTGGSHLSAESLSCQITTRRPMMRLPRLRDELGVVFIHGFVLLDNVEIAFHPDPQQVSPCRDLFQAMLSHPRSFLSRQCA